MIQSQNDVCSFWSITHVVVTYFCIIYLYFAKNYIAVKKRLTELN